MDKATLRTVPVGASDEEFTTQVGKDDVVLVVQWIAAERKVRVLAGEHNSHVATVSLHGRDALCRPGSEIALPAELGIVDLQISFGR
jgi:hypothetical protein